MDLTPETTLPTTKEELLDLIKAIHHAYFNEKKSTELITKLRQVHNAWKGTGITYKENLRNLNEENRQLSDELFQDWRVHQKTTLIKRATNLPQFNCWKVGTNEAVLLRKQWKNSGKVNHTQENKLYRRFNSAINHYYYLYREELKRRAEKKDNLTVQLENLKNQTTEQNYSTSIKAMNVLFNKWKEIGYSGDAENHRWEKFNDIRNTIYQIRREDNLKHKSK